MASIAPEREPAEGGDTTGLGKRYVKANLNQGTGRFMLCCVAGDRFGNMVRRKVEHGSKFRPEKYLTWCWGS